MPEAHVGEIPDQDSDVLAIELRLTDRQRQCLEIITGSLVEQKYLEPLDAYDY
jgi:hypothetical protein